MSGSREYSDGWRPEKSNFVQTCNLLSQYIKEKGSLRDLNIEIGGKVENLENLVKPGSACTTVQNNKGKSQQPLRVSDTVEEASCKPTSKEVATTDTKTAQLTIFYSGKVLVFDDYPANKAKELVAFAKKGSSQMSYGILSNTLCEKPSSGGAVAAATSSQREGLPPRPHQTSSSSHKGVGISSNTCKEIPSTVASGLGISSNTCKEMPSTVAGGAVAMSSASEAPVSPQAEASGSDMPIARRSSLHRFLEKRKDRAAVRGPYHQVQEQPTSSSPKGDERLELKL